MRVGEGVGHLWRVDIIDRWVRSTIDEVCLPAVLAMVKILGIPSVPMDG